MEAIVFESHTGHTAAYARLLAEKTGLPVWPLAEAKTALAAGTPVLFLGWVMAGGIRGLKKARARYQVRGVCAVGMTPPDGETREKLREQNALGDVPLFLLPGGVEMKKLHGPYRWIMRMVLRGLESKPEPTKADRAMLRLCRAGGARPDADALRDVMAFWEGV